MTPIQEQYLRILLYVVGWALSIAWPFLLVKVKTGAAFDWRLVSGRIFGGLGGLALLLLSGEEMARVGASSYLGALIAGAGASELGNNVRRSVDAKRA